MIVEIDDGARRSGGVKSELSTSAKGVEAPGTLFSHSTKSTSKMWSERLLGIFDERCLKCSISRCVLWPGEGLTYG